MIEILKFVNAKDKNNDFIIGHTQVKVADKMTLWFTVMRSKEGKPFYELELTLIIDKGSEKEHEILK